MATDTFALSLEHREITGKKVKLLRREGIIPIAVFGRGLEPYNAQVNERDFMKVINRAGYSSLIELDISGQINQQAFVQEIQRHPVSLRIMHADLRIVDMTKLTTVEIPVVLHGENKHVEANRAVINQPMSTIQITALPGNIPHQIDVDISELTEVGQAIHVRDLTFSSDLEIHVDADEVVISLNAAPRMAAETADAEADAGETADADTADTADTEE